MISVFQSFFCTYSHDIHIYLTDDNAKAWKLNESGETAWSATTSPAIGAAGNSKPVYKEHFTHPTKQ